MIDIRLPFSTILIALTFSTLVHAQAPTIEWAKTLGGSAVDVASSIQQTSDGGFIMAGYSDSRNGDVSGNHGNWDYWIVKLTSAGAIQWEKSLGGSSEDATTFIQQTSDSGFIVAGYTSSKNGEVTGNQSDIAYNCWIVKLTSEGAIQWENAFGGSYSDGALCIRQTSDGGFIVAAASNSMDGDVTGHHAYTSTTDYWILKLTSAGVLEWEKSLGGSGDDIPYSIQQTSDGGFIVAGESNSTDGDVTGNHGGFDYWIVKLSDTGVIQWEKSLGGSNVDDVKRIQQTSDGGFIIAGFSYSNDGDVTGHHGLTGSYGHADCWIVKLNDTGTIEWEKSIGGTAQEEAYSIQQTSDGGFIVGADSWSNDGDVTGHHGDSLSFDYWIVKLSNNGAIEWEESLGGTRDDQVSCIRQTADGGFIMAGTSNSIDGQVNGRNDSTTDCWIVKLQPESSVSSASQSETTLESYPDPFRSFTRIVAPGATEILIVNVLGMHVASLTESAPGEFIWTPDSPLQAGTYFAVVKGRGSERIKPITLMR